ncbi:MAG: AAA family ATPase [Actinobacteria bacterium]|nr:AAA family ATPase [Actinomycetota bacterium]
MTAGSPQGRLVLVVDPDLGFADALTAMLPDDRIVGARSMEEAAAIAEGGRFDLALVGPSFGTEPGVAAAAVLREADRTLLTVLVADVPTNRVLRMALRSGFADVIDAPLSTRKLGEVLSRTDALDEARSVPVVLASAAPPAGHPHVSMDPIEEPGAATAPEPPPTRSLPDQLPATPAITTPAPPAFGAFTAPQATFESFSSGSGTEAIFADEIAAAAPAAPQAAPIPAPPAPAPLDMPIAAPPELIAPPAAVAEPSVPVQDVPFAPPMLPSPPPPPELLVEAPPMPATPPPMPGMAAPMSIPQVAAVEVPLAHRRPGGGRVITVMAGKGGSGKTITATNLAAALTERLGEDKVVIVDADLQFGDVALMLQIDPSRTIVDAAAIIDELTEPRLDAILLRHDSGLRVMPAPLVPAGADKIGPKDVVRVVEMLRGMYSFVVVDTAPIFDDGLITLLEHSDDVLLVVDMDLPSVKNAKIALDTLRAIGFDTGKVHLTVNRANSKARLDLAELERALGEKVAASIPSDRLIPQSVNEGVPAVTFSPRSRVAKAFYTLAELFLPR